jgi:hypothetical protein
MAGRPLRRERMRKNGADDGHSVVSPTASGYELMGLAVRYPEEVLASAALDVLSLEDPAKFHEVWEYAVRRACGFIIDDAVAILNYGRGQHVAGDIAGCVPGINREQTALFFQETLGSQRLYKNQVEAMREAIRSTIQQVTHRLPWPRKGLTGHMMTMATLACCLLGRELPHYLKESR